MKAKHNKRLMMFENVIRTMDTHFKTWSGVAELSRTYDRFVKRYKKLTDLKLEEDVDLRPHIERYMEKRKELMEKLIPMVSAVSVFAGDTGDKKLKKQTDLTARGISKMKDRALSELTHTLVRVGSAQWRNGAEKKKSKKTPGKELNDYGLTVNMMEELEEAQGEMIAAKKALREAEKHRNRCARDIVRISKANNKLLKKRLDRLVGVFQVSDPEFYTSYMVARGSMKPGKADSKEKDDAGESKSATGATGSPVKTSTRKPPAHPTGTASKRKTTIKPSGKAGQSRTASTSTSAKKTTGRSAASKKATGKTTASKKPEARNDSGKKESGN